MYKLYARPAAGNVCVEAMLAECAAQYEVIALDRDAQGHLPDSLRAMNPMMQVPTLVLPGGQVMTESAAILIYLGDAFPQSGLAPQATSPQRGQYLRWMVFLATTLYMSDLRLYYPHKYTTEPSSTGGIKAKAAADMDDEFAVLAGVLGAKPYLLGDKMSALDIYAAMLINWGPDMAALGARHPNLKALHDGVSSRPAIAPVWERNGMGQG